MLIESTRDLVDWCRVFEDAHPLEILRWAGEEFGDGLVVTASFGDAVLVHLVSQAIPDAEVVLLDTGYLFAETEWYAEHLRQRVRPQPARRRTPPDAVRRPVADRHRRLLRRPQGRADAAGARRQDGVGQRPAPRRLAVPRDRRPIVHVDLLRDITKINPIATWTDEDVDHYKAMELLPEHPLTDRGLRLDRLLAVHPAGRAGRGRPRRALGRLRQDRVRAARLDARPVDRPSAAR